MRNPAGQKYSYARRAIPVIGDRASLYGLIIEHGVKCKDFLAALLVFEIKSSKVLFENNFERQGQGTLKSLPDLCADCRPGCFRENNAWSTTADI